MSTPGNSPSKKREEHSEKELEEVNAFFSKLEVGDLCFMKIMEYGLALFGETKAGKTTLAHHLILNPLIGTSDLAYELKGDPKLFKEAIIGHQPVSQTEIPNEIGVTVRGGKEEKEVKLHILDCPGYSDSKGCHMVIANGYFHYRIFSKVLNLKFVITFDYKHVSGIFEKPKNTLIEFMMSFKNFKEIREQVINATSFVFTKLDRFGQSD
jgi:GTPase SAR1 family protein